MLGLKRASSTLAILVCVSTLGLGQGRSPKPLCTPDPSSDVIFVGTLTELTPKEAQMRGWSSATFEVSELFEGDAPGTVDLLVGNDICQSESREFRVADAYLITTRKLLKGTGQLDRCDQIRPLADVSTELQYLRSALSGATGSEVSGKVLVDPQGYPWKQPPLPKTKVHLSDGKQRFDFVADENGNFGGPLPPGKYTQSTDFPTGYEAFYGTYPLTVAEHHCTSLMIAARPTASFIAHIIDVDGEDLAPLLSNVQLTLETEDGQEFVRSVWPDENSDLKAENLMPGRYVLGLNTWLGIVRGTKYPATYFPGVSSRADAMVISLQPGEHKVLPEMQIKKGEVCDIPVLVTDSTGKPSPAATIALAYRDYPHLVTMSGSAGTDLNGRDSIYAVFPGPVFLRAEKERGDGFRLQSRSEEVDSCPTKSVVLALSQVVDDKPKQPNN